MPRKQYKYHYIYKTRCTITNKFYIGMHSTNNLEDGYLGSGKRLWYSIKKHGKENHLLEILEFLPDRESLKKRERELVNEDLLKDLMCMNLVIGGEGGASGKLNPFYGHKVSKEHREAMIQGTREKFKKSTREDRLKIAAKQKESRISKYGYDPAAISMKGKTHSEETKQKLKDRDYSYLIGRDAVTKGYVWVNYAGNNKQIDSKLLDEYLNNGWIKGMTNTDKMRESALNRVWITNGTDNKRIKIEELNNLLSEGWYKGQVRHKKK